MLTASDAALAGSVQAKPAHEFVNSVGVVTDFSWGASIYATRYDNVKAALAELGVHFIRDRPGNPTATTRFKKLWQTYGIKLNAVVDTRTRGAVDARLDPSKIATQLAILKSQIGVQALAAIEGPNEYNGLEAFYGYRNWPGELRAYQTALFNAIKADNALRGQWIVGPSTVYPATAYWYDRLGYIAPVVDANNIHAYSNWQPLAPKLDEIARVAR
jgi:hypothetical protein